MTIKERYRKTFDQVADNGIEPLTKEDIINATIPEKETTPTRNSSRTSSFMKPAFIIAMAVIVVLFCGTAIAAVATNFWSEGLDDAVKGNEEQRQTLTAEGMAVNIDAEPITVNGITVTPLLAITDGTVGYISIKVEGYALDETKGRPMFLSKGDYYLRDAPQSDPLEEMQIEGLHWWSGGDHKNGFYDGIVSWSDGNYYFADGEMAETDFYGAPIGRFLAEDGSLEYIAEVMTNDPEYSLFGETVSFEMMDLCTQDYLFNETVHGKHYSNVVEGTWAFEVTFPEKADIQTENIQLDYGLEGADCQITGISITPLAIAINYTTPEEKNLLTVDKIILDTGETIELDYPYFLTWTAPDIPSRTTTAIGCIVDVDTIDSIGVTYAYYDGSGKDNVQEIIKIR